MKALIVFGSDQADYLLDLLTDGLRAVCGPANVSWWPRKAHLATAEPPTKVPERICWIGPPDAAVDDPVAAVAALDPGDVLVLGSTLVNATSAGMIQRQAAKTARARKVHVVGVDGEDIPASGWASTVWDLVDQFFVRERVPGAYGGSPIAFPFNPRFVPPVQPWGYRDIPLLWSGFVGWGREDKVLALAGVPGAVLRGGGPFNEWLGLLARARTALVLHGRGKQTYRYWEVAAAGCLPVIERLPFSLPYDLADGVASIVFDGAADLPAAVERAARDTEAMAATAREIAWARHTPEATARGVVGAL